MISTHGQKVRAWVRSMNRAIALSPVRDTLRTVSLSGWLPRFIWARLPVDGVFSVSTTGKSFLYDGSADDVDARQLFWRGLAGNEGETLEEFQREVLGAELVVDVGANRGLYTLTALAVSSDVCLVAIEASPRTFEHLAAMVALNGWSDRVVAVNAAAGATAGYLPFHVPGALYASSARLLCASHRSDTTGDIIEVPVVTLDDLVASADVIKIDVEGAEHLVLAGMRRLMAASRPVIIIEVLPESQLAECELLLRSAGYRFFHLSANGAQLRRGLSPDFARRYRNYLCRPSPTLCT